MMKKIYITLAFAAVVALIFAPSAISEKKNNDEASVIRNLDIFNSLYKELNTYYVDTLDAKKSIDIAINSMLDNIDPYTEYIASENQDDFMVISTGEYGGIGSYIMQRKSGGVFISGPYEGSPAAKAGIKCGDHIIMIDGDSVANWTSDKVSKKLKGQANTQLTVTVKRPYTDDSIKTFTLTREKIKINPVPYYGVVRDNIGYIDVTTFNEHTGENVKKAILEFKQNPAVKYLVIDLRGNGGGLVDEAIKVIGYFVPKGTQVLETKGRNTANYRLYKTTEEPIAADMPLAILVDGGSASASEITAGALQDLDRAVIIGGRSFGKGLVQSTRPLPFDGLLKVTVAKYYIPSGRLIQEIDYSKRNEDGTVKEKTDTVGNIFHTAHGREVRDGGGITPDIKVDFPTINRLVYNITLDNWAFDFATKYAAEHPTIPSARDFKITDEIFNEFKAFIKPDKFQYDKVCETGLEKLRKTAETEGYMNDSVKAEFDKMEKLLKHDLNTDLDHNRKAISTLLSGEIIKRYYFDAGEVENDTNDDDCLDKAEAMFTKAGEYEKVLNLAAPKAKTSTPAKKKKGKK